MTPELQPLSSAIQALLARVSWDAPGAAIEAESLARVDAECGELASLLPKGAWPVARRLVHASADPALARSLSFRHDAVEAGVQALLRGAPLVCDSRMIRAGLSLPRLRRCSPLYGEERVLCRAADEDVAREASRRGTTRALLGMEKAFSLGELEGAIVLVGNAPLALARLCRLALEEGARPALVVGMPVGFVNVLESKELLKACPVPQIVLEGRRGGSPLAVACLHALAELAIERRERC